MKLMTKIKFKINNVEEEKQIIEMTRKEVDFFRENKIKITWPQNSTAEEEYDKEKYQKELRAIKKRWKEESDFLKKVSTHFNKEVGDLTVKISAYGPMGFYDSKRGVITVNFNNKKPVKTIKHEIIHTMLALSGKEPDDHKEKERRVNKILSKIEDG